MLFRIDAQTAQFLPFNDAFHAAILTFASLIASSLLEASTLIVLLLLILQQQVSHSIWVLALRVFILFFSGSFVSMSQIYAYHDCASTVIFYRQ